jgi:uncharacterized protein with von Willebrand factor type A (vWA) domain
MVLTGAVCSMHGTSAACAHAAALAPACEQLALFGSMVVWSLKSRVYVCADLPLQDG